MRIDPRTAIRTQRGMTLVALIGVLAAFGCAALVLLKVSPTVMEYSSIKKAMAHAKENGKSVREIQAAFDRQAAVGYIETINGRDLDIVQSDTGFDVSFAYTKKVKLAGPVSLLIDYAGTTATRPPSPAKTD